MPAIGQLISGRYRLVEVIGHGGMATIYRAHDTQLDRDVAVKALHPHLGQDRVFVRRFAAEARRAASVIDEHVIGILDVATGEEAPAIVMELAAGDLSRLIAREAPIQPTRAARIAADVAGGLSAAHRIRIIHRDVKPGNILLTRDGEVRVTDFGIARAAGDESLTATGTALGSVDYFSPEQARGAPATARSDIYALGVVLFELLTGTRPFHGESPYAVAIDRLVRLPPDPRAVRPEVPPGLAAITTRAMAVEPKARYPSAGAMRRALLGWLASQEAEAATPVVAPVRAPMPPDGLPAPAPQAPLARGPERRRSLVPALLVLVVLTAVGYLAGGIIDPDNVTAPGPSRPVAVGSAVGVLMPTPSPTIDVTPMPTASAAPTATPAPTPVPPTPAATAVPTPVPTAVVAAARPVELDPGETVAAWYGYVANGDFDAAYALWSARMRADYPRQGNLDGRWDDTARVTFNQLYIAEQTESTAKVQVDFVETKDSGATYRFVGWWDLVLVDGRWLLDHPNF